MLTTTNPVQYIPHSTSYKFLTLFLLFIKSTHPVFGTKDVSSATFKPFASCSKETNHFTPLISNNLLK